MFVVKLVLVWREGARNVHLLYLTSLQARSHILTVVAMTTHVFVCVQM